MIQVQRPSLLLNIINNIKSQYITSAVYRLNRIPVDQAPLFSVVIPIYDRVVEVREAIESILMQSFRNFELLLICDGSPAETRNLVESYSALSQVRIFHFEQSSGNACRGRNKGIEMAGGRYVAFLDSDDIAMSSRLERTLFHFLDKKVDVVGGAIEYLVEDQENREFRNGQIGFTSEECTYDLLREGNRLSICTVAVKRDLLLRYGGFREEMRYREDHELWLRLAYQGCTIYNSPEVLARYRIHPGNAEQQYLNDDEFWYQTALKLHTEINLEESSGDFEKSI